MQGKNSDPGSIPALQLLLFAFGGFASLFYGGVILELLHMDSAAVWKTLWWLLLWDGVLAASLTATILLPLSTALFGFFSACGVREILEHFGASEEAWKGSAILLLFLVLAHFALSSLGMKNASVLRAFLRAHGELGWKRRLIPYMVMLIVPAAFLLLRSM